MRRHKGGDCGGTCLWGKAGQPWKQGDTAESCIGCGAITIASLPPHASIGSWTIEQTTGVRPQKRWNQGTSLVVQWLRLCTPNPEGWVRSLVRELRSMHTTWHNLKKFLMGPGNSALPELPISIIIWFSAYRLYLPHWRLESTTNRGKRDSRQLSVLTASNFTIRERLCQLKF